MLRVGVVAGRVVVGPGPGRGAWVCATNSCVDGLDSAGLARALRGGVHAADLASSKLVLRDAVRAGVRD